MKLAMINHRIGIGLIAGLLVAGANLFADDKESGQTDKHAGKSGDPATCISEAAKMNMATIRFAQLASQKAESSELKQFARMLEQDHKQAQSDLKSLAQKHNATLPTALDAKCEEEISKLQGKSGQEFDREFAKGAVEGHAMAVAHLEQATREAQDNDLRMYSRKMLSKVKEHQQRGREVAKAVGVDDATIASLERKAQDAAGSAPGSRSESSTQRSDSNSNSSKQEKNTNPEEK
jgi:putative membrane protein